MIWMLTPAQIGDEQVQTQLSSSDFAIEFSHPILFQTKNLYPDQVEAISPLWTLRPTNGSSELHRLMNLLLTRELSCPQP